MRALIMGNNEFEFEYGLRKATEGKHGAPATVNISVRLVNDTPYMLITGKQVGTAVPLSKEDFERVKAIIWIQNFLLC